MLLFKQSIKKIQTGAVLVEFAIIIPLLLLLVVGICEFSFAFYHFNILNKSVQDGARYFSDPLRARKGGTTLPIDTRTATSPGNGTNITETENLVIFGNIAGTGSSLMPTDASNYTITVHCAEEVPPNDDDKECLATTQHIRVTGSYTHNFILGNALNQLTSGAVPNVYTLTASSTLRVE